MDATQIITRTNSLILVEFAALYFAVFFFFFFFFFIKFDSGVYKFLTKFVTVSEFENVSVFYACHVFSYRMLPKRAIS